MKIPTEAELIEMEQRVRQLERYGDEDYEHIVQDFTALADLVRELRPCQ